MFGQLQRSQCAKTAQKRPLYRHAAKAHHFAVSTRPPHHEAATAAYHRSRLREVEVLIWHLYRFRRLGGYFLGNSQVLCITAGRCGLSCMRQGLTRDLGVNGSVELFIFNCMCFCPHFQRDSYQCQRRRFAYRFLFQLNRSQGHLATVSDSGQRAQRNADAVGLPAQSWRRRRSQGRPAFPPPLGSLNASQHFSLPVPSGVVAV